MRILLLKWLPQLILLLSVLAAGAADAERITATVQAILDGLEPDCVQEGPPCSPHPDR